MKPNRGILALLLTVLIWGSTFVITKSALRDVGPLALNTLRFVIAFAILAPLAHRQGYRLRLSVRPVFLRFGLSGVAFYYTLQNLGLLYTSTVNTVLVLTIIPAVTALLAVWLLKERLGPWQLVGIFLALLGAAVVGLGTQNSSQAPNPLLGNLMIAGSVLSWAIYTIQGKRLVTEYRALVTTTASFGAGMLLLLPLGIGEVFLSGIPELSREGLVAALYLGLLATALPMFLWNYALTYVDASIASLYLNLIPVVGVGIALLTGESVGAWQAVGGFLTLAGVWVSSRAPAAPATRQSDRRPAA